MSEKLGSVRYAGQQMMYLGSAVQDNSQLSPQTEEIIDAEVRRHHHRAVGAGPRRCCMEHRAALETPGRPAAGAGDGGWHRRRRSPRGPREKARAPAPPGRRTRPRPWPGCRSPVRGRSSPKPRPRESPGAGRRKRCRRCVSRRRAAWRRPLRRLLLGRHGVAQALPRIDEGLGPVHLQVLGQLDDVDAGP